MKIEKIKMTVSEYRTLSTGRVEFLNLGKGRKSENWLKKFSAISSMIPTDIVKVFDKCSFVFPASEGRLYVWCLKFEGTDFFIISRNHRGTSVESASNDIKFIERFADTFLEYFKDNEDVKNWLNLKYKRYTIANRIKDLLCKKNN